MEPNEQDLELIERFLDGELAGAELQELTQRLKAEPALAEALAVQQDIRQALGQAGRTEMKARLGVIGAAVAAEGGVQDYKPTGRDTGAPGKSTFTTIIVLIVAMTTLLIYQYLQRSEQSEQIPAPADTVVPAEETPIMEVNWDTINRPLPEGEATIVEPKIEQVITKQETILTRFQVINGDTVQVPNDSKSSTNHNLEEGQQIERIDTLYKVELHLE